MKPIKLSLQLVQSTYRKRLFEPLEPGDEVLLPAPYFRKLFFEIIKTAEGTPLLKLPVVLIQTSR